MSVVCSRGPDLVWQEVLRRAAISLGGRTVGVWEADAAGHLHLLAASADDVAPVEQLEATLREWGELPGRRPPPHRWLASPLTQQRWCIAPVRGTLPQPPPGAERRGPERMTLELAGVCLGLLDEVAPPQAFDQDFFENAAVGLSWLTPDGTIAQANRAELELTGYARDQYVGRDARELHGDPAIVDDLLRRLRAGETVHNVAARLRHRDGTIRHVLISASPQLDGERLVRARCITRDVTDLKGAEQTLAYFKAIVDSADDAIVGKTLDGVITSWNHGATRLYGYEPHEVIGKQITLLVPPDRRDELPAVFTSLRRGDRVEHYETTRVRKDGSRVDVSVSISPILDAEGQPLGATAITRDITYRRQAERQLLHGALHDAITDLPNRTSFLERVTQALARTQRDHDYRFAVLFIDCDRFKTINDDFGHAAGDRVLVEIADRLRASVRPGDVVARLGGDEFTLLVEDVTGAPEVEHAARRILDGLAAPFCLQGQEVRASASIGGVLSGPLYTQAQDMLRDSDLAMYRAKKRGRACFQLFDAEMRDWAHARSGMEADLRDALARHEFRLVFQPIVELETARVRGFEALLRWHHPRRREMLPAEFLPLAEQTGLIIPIGSWALREACRHARAWQDVAPGGSRVRVSVNLSTRELAHPILVEDVRKALEDHGLAPTSLVLDVSEGSLMQDVESSIATLHRLRELGVQLHMDDFGSAYSSLSYLTRFPLDAIKVDRMFVHRMGARRTDLEIVRSIVDLAEHLGLAVIAEAVETPVQRERLIAFGCEQGQGFLFAQPLESDAARALLVEQQVPAPV